MSTANYILICNGRGKLATAKNPEGSILAAMDCAAAVVSFVENRYASHTLPPETSAIIENISDSQHEMMEMLIDDAVTKEKAVEATTAMFDHLDQLEEALAT